MKRSQKILATIFSVLNHPRHVTAKENLPKHLEKGNIIFELILKQRKTMIMSKKCCDILSILSVFLTKLNLPLHDKNKVDEVFRSQSQLGNEFQIDQTAIEEDEYLI